MSRTTEQVFSEHVLLATRLTCGATLRRLSHLARACVRLRALGPRSGRETRR
jgi:hypothetical protein